MEQRSREVTAENEMRENEFHELIRERARTEGDGASVD